MPTRRDDEVCGEDAVSDYEPKSRYDRALREQEEKKNRTDERRGRRRGGWEDRPSISLLVR